MFFLTHGILKKLLQKKSLFDQASGSTSLCTTIRLNFIEELCIVKCVDLVEFVENCVGLELFDGDENLRVYLDFNNCSHNLLKTDYILKTGSIILINEISFAKLVDLNNSRLDYDLPDIVLVIKSFHLVGFEEIKDTSNELIKSSDSTSFLISNIKPGISNNNWSVRCRLEDITKLTQFQNQMTFNTGTKLRAKFFDGCNYIEVVAFNEETKKLLDLELGLVYNILNGNVKQSLMRFRSWPDQVDNSDYEIVVRPDTKIIKSENQSIAIIDRKLSPSCKTSLKNKDEEYASDVSSSPEKQCLNSKYIPINLLPECSSGSKVNVIGIVYMIQEDLKYIKTKYDPLRDLELRNIELIDKAKITIKCAFWGKEAKNFNFKLGDVLEFKDLEINSYGGGLSLSKQKFSSVRKISTSNDSSIVTLNQWYSDWTDSIKRTKEKPITMASFLQKRKRDGFKEEESPRKKKRLN